MSPLQLLPHESGNSVGHDARRVIAAWDQRASDVEGIWLRCFNAEEAAAVQRSVRQLRPDVVLYVSHMVFGVAAERLQGEDGRRP